MRKLDQFQGCLIGGAMGDALGYAVEFYTEDDIYQDYGSEGITEYELFNGKALISDDTQMTLFTAVALLKGVDYISQINESYLDWLSTQSTKKRKKPYCELHSIKALHSLRAPGGTCLNALRNGGNGSLEKPINDSKGCGGVMRVAPIGLYCKEDVALLGAKAAALTHGHELGYIPAALLSELIHLIVSNENVTLETFVMKALGKVEELFSDKKEYPYFMALIHKAIELSKSNRDDLECIHELGEGWVAEETLAIAIYCSLKYSHDFKKAIITSVNHSGDSDSTGAVTGNILGAYLGLKKLPKEYLDHLELKDLILDVAKDLYIGYNGQA